MSAVGRPQASEADPLYFRYIDLVPGADPVPALEAQLASISTLGAQVSEEQSLHRYAPEKWSARQVLNHVTDTERAFAFRVLWFARGFDAPLASYDQEIAAAAAHADDIAWREHIEEFRRVRLATLALITHLPADAWDRAGVASGKRITVRALAYLIPGHIAHHLTVLRERYGVAC
ncbi:MAG: DinB family protein [Terriglobales bacterium]